MTPDNPQPENPNMVLIERLYQISINGVKGEPDAVVVKMTMQNGNIYHVGMTVEDLAQLAMRFAMDAAAIRKFSMPAEGVQPN